MDYEGIFGFYHFWVLRQNTQKQTIKNQQARLQAWNELKV